MKLLSNTIWWVHINKGDWEKSEGIIAENFEALIPLIEALLEKEPSGFEVKEIRRGPTVKIPSTKTITVDV